MTGAVSHYVSIAVLVTATRWKGSSRDEFAALVIGPLTVVQEVLDHLLLSRRQVSCHPGGPDPLSDSAVRSDQSLRGNRSSGPIKPFQDPFHWSAPLVSRSN